MDVASDLKASPTTKQKVSISTTAPATNTDNDGAGASASPSGAHVGLTPGPLEDAEDKCPATVATTNTDNNGAGTSSSGEPVGLTPGQSEEAKDKCWDIVHVIHTAEEHIPCCTKDYCKNAAVSWESNLNPGNHWHLCEGCQVNK